MGCVSRFCFPSQPSHALAKELKTTSHFRPPPHHNTARPQTQATNEAQQRLAYLGCGPPSICLEPALPRVVVSKCSCPPPFLFPLPLTTNTGPRQASATTTRQARPRPRQEAHAPPAPTGADATRHAGPRPAARHRSPPSHHDQHARQGKTPHRRRRQRPRQQQRQLIGRNARPTVASQGFSTPPQRATPAFGAGFGPTGALCLARAVEDGPALEAASGRARRRHGPRARLGRPL